MLFHDLDVIGHVNHIRYAEWVIDSLPREFLFSHHPARLDINFQAESSCEDLIYFSLIEKDPLTYEHLLYKPDGTPIIRARTFWRPKD